MFDGDGDRRTRERYMYRRENAHEHTTGFGDNDYTTIFDKVVCDGLALVLVLMVVLLLLPFLWCLRCRLFSFPLVHMGRIKRVPAKFLLRECVCVLHCVYVNE